MPRVARRPAAKRPARRNGEADTLHGPAWRAWVLRVKLHTGPSWLHACICLSHLLCARVTQVLLLKLEHFDFAGKTVEVQGMKGQATSRKPLSQAAMELLTTWRAEGGVAVQRSRRWGSHGTRSYTDRWNWPSDSSQHLFPSTRKDSKLGRTTKDRCVIIFMSEASRS